MDFRSKQILVAGGAGLVGTNLLERLLPSGAKIRATIHKRPPWITSPDVEYIKCDLTKPEDCKRVVEGIDYVFMCAASTFGAGILSKNPLIYLTPNVLMNTLMLEASYHAKVKKFLYVGSSTAYPPSDRPVKEEELFNGDPYEDYFSIGWVKRFTEKMCQMYSERMREPMTTIVLRGTNIYGPYANFDLEQAHVMAALIRKVVERHNPVEVWGTGNDIRDLIYVDDFVDAMLLAMDKIELFEAINIGYGRGFSVKEVLQAILDCDWLQDGKQDNYKPEIVFNPAKPSTIPERYVDTSKAKALLGFEAKTDLREGIRKTIEWYRKNTT